MAVLKWCCIEARIPERHTGCTPYAQALLGHSLLFMDSFNEISTKEGKLIRYLNKTSYLTRIKNNNNILIKILT